MQHSLGLSCESNCSLQYIQIGLKVNPLRFRRPESECCLLGGFARAEFSS